MRTTWMRCSRIVAGAGAACAGMVWSSGADRPVSATSTYQEYVSMGDSWTADAAFVPPPVNDHAPIDCYQQSYNYPRQVAAALGIATFRDASCTDAGTPNLAGPQPGLQLSGTNPPQFSRLTPTTDLVTLSIGGRDLRFGVEVANNCLSLLSTPVATCATYVNQVRALIPRTESAIVTAIGQIRELSPNAQVFVVNYLQALPRTGCWPIIPVANSDMTLLYNVFNEANAMLARAASTAGVHYVDVWSQTGGHDICKGPTVRWVEGLIPVSINGVGVTGIFHPNSAGATAQAAAVIGAVRAVPPLVTTTTTTTTVATTTTTTTTPASVTPTEPPATAPPATAPPATEPSVSDPPAPAPSDAPAPTTAMPATSTA